MKTINMILTLALVATLNVSAHAATIAIIDSGTDLKHKDLVNKAWVNPIDIDDAVDNDDNGYIDDINGWNFAEQNNKVFDYKFKFEYMPDVYKFFEVQTRMLKGEATQADRDWYAVARKNDQLFEQLESFANRVHGTHVAGIASKNSDQAKLMILKLIATKAPKTKATLADSLAGTSLVKALTKSGKEPSEKLIKAGLKLLASQQGKTLAPIGKYVGLEKARLANCSFGTSTEAAKTILGPLLKLILKRDPTKEELQNYSSFFVGEVVKAYSAFFAPAPKTLFVIAAGNDGMDNDLSPTAPANIKAQNTIAVAATLGYKKLASFSNYGATMVEVAAPGVGILSTIPGDKYLTVSGTSQASPYVANVAALALDANPNLSNSDLKAILMGTVDMKAFLKGKVVSGGIVNTKRAMAAAKMTLSLQLKDAIDSSRLSVNDIDTGVDFSNGDDGFEGFVMPLPSLIQ
jgi:cell wall-associated protease